MSSVTVKCPKSETSGICETNVNITQDNVLWKYNADNVCQLLSLPISSHHSRGVQNPMKMSDIGFIKTEPNWPQNSKPKNSVSTEQFSKTDLSGLRTVFHIVSFTIHLQHDRINSQSTFLHTVSAC